MLKTSPRKDNWRLVIHWHPGCPEGVRPRSVSMFAGSDEDWKAHPEWYVDSEFFFDAKPSRSDFENVVRITPWLNADGYADMHAAIKANPWPYVPSVNKAINQELRVNGKVVGSLRVAKMTVYCAGSYTDVYVGCDFGNDVINRMFVGKMAALRTDARAWLMNNQCEVLEAVVDGGTAWDAREAIKKLLVRFKESLGDNNAKRNV